MSRWIAAALVGNEGDEAAVEWAATEAAPGDEIRIVCPVPTHASAVASWPVEADEGDIAQVQAQQRIDDAIDAVRRIRPPVIVSGSILFGPSSVVLGETVQAVDLLVLADDPWLTHPVVRDAACPVVVVPASAEAFDIGSAPVALLVDGSSLPTDAVQFAFEIAARRGTSLVVANTDAADATLAPDLAAWQDKYRSAGVIVDVHETSPAALRGSGQLVVTSRGSDAGDAPGRLALSALHAMSGPVAIVPDGAFA